jgi:glycosyltransferase involved in cell wall biosynthesis
MRIALVITCLDMGGAEAQVVDLSDRLASLGHVVTIISMTSDLVMMPGSSAVTVQTLGMKKNPVSVITAFRRACALLKDFRPDIVHSHMVHANIFCRLLRLAVSMPRLICTAHSTNEGSAFWMKVYRLTDCLAHLTTNVSQTALERAVARGAVPLRKVLLVYNGIDCERFRFDPVTRRALRQKFDVADSAQILLAAGRFCEAKDYPNLLRAFALLAARRNDCVLWIAGGGDSDGRDRAALEGLSTELGLTQHVRFLGFRRDVGDLMSAADIFVLSSAWEGFPLVVGEAMACERIVVSTDAGGVREWLGDSSLVVPVRDSVALADALSHALDLDDETRLARGRAARQQVLDRYSLDAVTARWEQIYSGNYSYG